MMELHLDLPSLYKIAATELVPIQWESLP